MPMFALHGVTKSGGSELGLGRREGGKRGVATWLGMLAQRQRAPGIRVSGRQGGKEGRPGKEPNAIITREADRP